MHDLAGTISPSFLTAFFGERIVPFAGFLGKIGPDAEITIGPK